MKKYSFTTFGLLISLLLLALLQRFDNNLHLVACSVGEGDGLLATYKNNQILIDGGPDRSVLDCLGRHIPFWDRTLEVVILTHPEEDHYGGLVEVFQRYRVKNYFYSGVDSGDKGYLVLKREVGGQKTTIRIAKEGTRIRVGMMQLDILGQPVSVPLENITEDDFNKTALITALHFGNFDALMASDWEANNYKDLLDRGRIEPVEYIKVPHHGSKNGLTKELLNAAFPQIAVISVGKNQWGHPSPETLSILSSLSDLRVLRTDQQTDPEVVSDGRKWWVRD